jgi:hypothetical protein
MMMREHFSMEETATEEEASFMFNNATHKVIKDSFKHAHL